MLNTTLILHNLALIFYVVAAVYSIVAFLAPRLPRIGAVVAAGAGLLAQLVLLVLRWRAGDHLPVTGLFETQHFFALWVGAASIYFFIRYKAHYFLPSAMAFALDLILTRGPAIL